MTAPATPADNPASPTTFSPDDLPARPIIPLPPLDRPRYVQVEASLHLATLPETAAILDADAAQEAAAAAPIWALVGYPDQIRRILYDSGIPIQDDWIAAAALRRAVAAIPFASGLLEPNTIAVGLTTTGHSYKAVYLPPRRRALRLRTDSAVLTFTLPLPPLIWIARWTAHSQAHSVVACTAYPGSAADQVYEAPLFNVAKGGAICFGNVALPGPQAVAAGASPAAVPLTTIVDAFFEAYFSPHYPDGKSLAHPSSLLAVWQGLSKAEPAPESYPLDDLVPAGTLAAMLQQNRTQLIRHARHPDP